MSGAMSARTYHIPCDARQTIAYTMSWPLGIPYIMPCLPSHTIYHSLPARPYNTPCHARQAIQYTMPCHQAIQYTMPSPMPCLAEHNHIPCDAYHAMPARPYYILCESARPYYTTCDAQQAIPYTITCSQGQTGAQTKYHTMRARPYNTI